MFGKMKQRRQENYLHVVHHELVREFAPVLRVSNSLGEEKNNLPKTNYKKIISNKKGDYLVVKHKICWKKNRFERTSYLIHQTVENGQGTVGTEQTEWQINIYLVHKKTKSLLFMTINYWLKMHHKNVYPV